MDAYLSASEVIDWQHPDILWVAQQIASLQKTTVAIAKACFEWVRDQIPDITLASAENHSLVIGNKFT